MRDKEAAEQEVRVKEGIKASIGVKNGGQETKLDDLKYEFVKKDDEGCELKEKGVKLGNDKVFHINELQKKNNATREVEQWKNEFNKQLEANKKLEEEINKTNEANKGLCGENVLLIAEVKKLEEENNNSTKEISELEKRVAELEEELLKRVIIECKPKGKPGRKPKEVR